MSRVFSNSLFKGLAEQLSDRCGQHSVTEGWRGYEAEAYLEGCYDLYGHIDTHDGSSYDGFWSHCEGWAEATFYFDPINDFGSQGLRLSGVGRHSKKRAKMLNAVIERMADERRAIMDWWDEDKLPAGFASVQTLADWWATSRQGDDDAFEQVDNYLREYYSETPAFLNVRVLLERHDYGYTAEISSAFNDDLEYGRERVGSWAGTGALGEPLGSHVIWKQVVEFGTEQELLDGIGVYLDAALSCIGGDAVSDETLDAIKCNSLVQEAAA